MLIGERLAGIEPDRLAVVGERAVEIARSLPDLAALGERNRIGRAEPDRLGVVGKRAVERAVVLKATGSRGSIRISSVRSLSARSCSPSAASARARPLSALAACGLCRSASL